MKIRWATYFLPCCFHLMLQDFLTGWKKIRERPKQWGDLTLHINPQLCARHGRERKGRHGKKRESNKDRKREEERTGSLPSLLLLIKTRHHRGARVCVRTCTAALHVHAATVPDVRLCVLMQKWQKKNNIIGEMYAVIIGIQKMIIHIKQGAQSQPHLHVLDYMHFKSNFRRAYEWH